MVSAGGSDELGPVLAWVLDRSHEASALEVAGLIDEAARRLAVGSTRLFLADLQQSRLNPLPQPGCEGPDAQAGVDIEGSLAGLAYRAQQVQRSRDGNTAWFPMVDGIERIGVMQASCSGPVADRMEAGCALASLATLLVVSQSSHNDLVVRHQRTNPMSLQAELLWAFLPPRTIGTHRATSTAMLEPAYDIGGDAFDHTFLDGTLHLTMVDAMGHDLASGGASAAAIAACRSTRRSGSPLPDIASTIDRTLARWIPDRLMTGVIAELDTHSGEFAWINCGHPPPLLIREGHVLPRALERVAELPLGLGFHDHTPPTLHHARLQPGDRVLIHSDGVTEARSPDGDLYGEERLTDTVIRSLASGHNAPEALRRLANNLLAHREHRLRDDATILLTEWHPTH
ncbi:PP2C family protein-serine/threonine phosphatase [Streptomyces sp. NRRL F-2664]|uniref:PP2C family protein-serine/threonine phosphatase n=1 Tax=Streptomyces sp. NRRL F-2664 TaxID=1463842 RepID=UPI0004C4DE71|nr:PP2C family protein-serine/threonine phosphatase [Streptomyces sp. NRRL F-2664]